MKYLFLLIPVLLFAQVGKQQIILQPPVGLQIDENDDINRGMVAYWAMNEGMGEEILDSKQQNNGTFDSVMDPVADWVSGYYGWSVDFDGNGDHISIGSRVSVLDISTAHTITAWFNADVVDASGDNIIFSQFDGTTIVSLGNRNQNLGFAVWDGSWTAKSLSFSDTDDWHFVVGTWDGSSTAQIFLDGIAGTGTTTPGGSQTEATFVGNRTDGGAGREWDGRINNIRIYDRVLPLEDILRLYAEPYAGFKAEQTVFLNAAAAAASESIKRKKANPIWWGKLKPRPIREFEMTQDEILLARLQGMTLSYQNEKPNDD